MMLDKLFDEHIELVKRLNESTEQNHNYQEILLEGFRKCARIVLGEIGYGRLLLSADNYYLSIGVDRPMCCGVFLTREK